MNNSTPPKNNGQSRIDEESAFINASIAKKQERENAKSEEIRKALQGETPPPELTKAPFVKPNGDVSRKY